ncbi:hypothetical protein [Amycolatopsis alba]|uniref:Carboxypeptidase regulatory-like domain-containing protein n=1 Tax=Amycolatopsis alba DSM 44262 TaxID=1125972 RepID=A0A229S3D8_AMYAL|nr:hypothetical protein [Amycolatopsis alba]OXM53104.1 hypothetical protein CFP75_07885 [Amycolatopsis alba DSM 44262]
MNLREPSGGERVDEVDFAILRRVRELWEAKDPLPPDLIDRIRFAAEIESADIAVLRPADAPEHAAARGDEPVRQRTFTCTCDELTVMVNLTSAGHGTVRVDGWLTPPGRHRVEVRTSTGSLETEADAGGRFAVQPVLSGPAQLIVSVSPRTFVTPTIEL